MEILLEIDDGVLELVVKSLNYSSVDSLNEDVRKIQEWMKKQLHFPEIMADKKIQNFLILSKGRIERCKESIENYYTVRTRLPEIFEKINPKLAHMEYLKLAYYFVPLPKLTKEMYRIFLYKARDVNVLEHFDPVDGVRYLVNLQEVRMAEDVTYGDVFIFDGENTPFSPILRITPMLIYKAMVVIYKQVFSNRLKGVYIINAPVFAEKLLALLRSVLKPKLIERIHFSKDSEDLIKHFGKEIIPKEYGGEEKSLVELQEMIYRKFQTLENYFDELDKLRINEELKPQKLKNDEMFGLSGNFKKLEID